MDRAIQLKDQVIDKLESLAKGSTKLIGITHRTFARELGVDVSTLDSIVQELTNEGFIQFQNSDALGLSLDGLTFYEYGGYSHLKSMQYIEGQDSFTRQAEEDRLRRLSLKKIENELDEQFYKTKLEIMENQSSNSHFRVGSFVKHRYLTLYDTDHQYCQLSPS